MTFKTFRSNAFFLTFGFKMEPDGTKIWPFGIEISRKCIVVFKVFEELAKFG